MLYASKIECSGGGINQNGKRTHGHGRQCGDCRGKGVHES